MPAHPSVPAEWRHPRIAGTLAHQLHQMPFKRWGKFHARHGGGLAAVPERELLNQEVIYQHGRFQRIRRWWRGVHPERGVIVRGWTGLETMEERDCLLPAQVVTIRID